MVHTHFPMNYCLTNTYIILLLHSTCIVITKNKLIKNVSPGKCTHSAVKNKPFIQITNERLQKVERAKGFVSQNVIYSLFEINNSINL